MLDAFADVLARPTRRRRRHLGRPRPGHTIDTAAGLAAAIAARATAPRSRPARGGDRRSLVARSSRATSCSSWAAAARTSSRSGSSAPRVLLMTGRRPRRGAPRRVNPAMPSRPATGRTCSPPQAGLGEARPRRGHGCRADDAEYARPVRATARRPERHPRASFDASRRRGVHVEFDAERVWVSGRTVLVDWHGACPTGRAPAEPRPRLPDLRAGRRAGDPARARAGR